MDNATSRFSGRFVDFPGLSLTRGQVSGALCHDLFRSHSQQHARNRPVCRYDAEVCVRTCGKALWPQSSASPTYVPSLAHCCRDAAQSRIESRCESFFELRAGRGEIQHQAGKVAVEASASSRVSASLVVAHRYIWRCFDSVSASRSKPTCRDVEWPPERRK